VGASVVISRPSATHLDAAAVEQPHVGVAEQGEHPQRVGGPPVVPVPVDDDRGVAADATLGHDLGEAGAVDVVAGDRVVELGVPVDLHRAGDVPGVVEQDVLVRLHHHQTGRPSGAPPARRW
jgi:hypothetical protein